MQALGPIDLSVAIPFGDSASLIFGYENPAIGKDLGIHRSIEISHFPSRQAIRANLAAPNSHRSLVGMGWCYMQLGQKEDARAAFQRALQLGSTDEAAREGFRRAGS